MGLVLDCINKPPITKCLPTLPSNANLIRDIENENDTVKVL